MPSPHASPVLPERGDALPSRIHIIVSCADPADECAELATGLGAAQKTVPPKYFYDDAGAELFERITELPEYYPTRTEHAILTGAAAEIARLAMPADLAELGSGSARKTRLLIAALFAAAPHNRALTYLPIDVSTAAVGDSASALTAEFPLLVVNGLIAGYEPALSALPRRTAPRRIVAFLGSTIGNLDEFETERFFARVAAALEPDDCFLLGFDLVKPSTILEPAYDDAAGVTAAFNLNLLRHLNRRFEGTFDLARFSHRAFWNEAASRIEMHLVSARRQRVTLRRLGLEFAFGAGETLRTEISRKFTVGSMIETVARHGFEPLKRWSDPREWFCVALFRRV